MRRDMHEGVIEVDDALDHEFPNGDGPATKEIVSYDPEFAKPYYIMTPIEKKAWRRGNRKKFVGAGYALTTVGGGTFFGGIEMLKGASLIHTATNIAGFEIMTTAIFGIATGISFLLMLLPWEDA